MNLNITLQIIISQTLLGPYYAHRSSRNRSPFSSTAKPDRIGISHISAIDVCLASIHKLKNHPLTPFTPSRSPCRFFLFGYLNQKEEMAHMLVFFFLDACFGTLGNT